MFITPLSGINPVAEITSQLEAVKTEKQENSFSDILSDLISNVNETDMASKEDILKIATGDSDDLHTIAINSEKAELALLTLIQVRNKVLDSYNEIMKVTL